MPNDNKFAYDRDYIPDAKLVEIAYVAGNIHSGDSAEKIANAIKQSNSLISSDNGFISDFTSKYDIIASSADRMTWSQSGLDALIISDKITKTRYLLVSGDNSTDDLD